MKKFLAILFAFSLALAIIGCGDDDSSSNDTGNNGGATPPITDVVYDGGKLTLKASSTIPADDAFTKGVRYFVYNNGTFETTGSLTGVFSGSTITIDNTTAISDYINDGYTVVLYAYAVPKGENDYQGGVRDYTVENLFNAGWVFNYDSANLPENLADPLSCNKCHMEKVMKHGYLPTVLKLSYKGGTSTVDGGFYACYTCHNYAGQYGSNILFHGGNDNVQIRIKLGNTVHAYHAQEFDYPQSMQSCVTCHEDKTATVLADANFKYENCISCHGDFIDNETLRADIGIDFSQTSFHEDYDTNTDCTLCHKTVGGIAPSFAKIHNNGYDKHKYDANGKKWSERIKVEIIDFALDNVSSPTTATIKWGVKLDNTTYIPLGGDGDFTFGREYRGAVRHVYFGVAYYLGDSKNIIDYNGGSIDENNVDNLSSANTTENEDNTYTTTIDLSKFANYNPKRIAAYVGNRIFLNYKGEAIVIRPAFESYDISSGALQSWSRPVVAEEAKCDTCHDTFGMEAVHNYAAAGDPVACSTCHNVGSAAHGVVGGSRSIDAYLHYLHAGGALDGEREAAMEEWPIFYDKKVGLLNCESCHKAGTYEVPDQLLSAPSVTSNFEALGLSIDAKIQGPAERACGSCHIAKDMVEGMDDDTIGLGYIYDLVSHFNQMGLDYTDNDTTKNASDVVAAYNADGSVYVGKEACGICHKNAGSYHQAGYKNIAKDLGIKIDAVE